MGRPGLGHFAVCSTKSGSFCMGRCRLPLGLVVAIAGVIISYSVFSLMRSRELSVAREQFLRSGESRAEVLRHAFSEQIGAVDVLAAFFSGSDLVDRKEFHTFTEPLFESHPHLLALGWASSVQNSQRRSHERAIRDEIAAGYKITERDGSGKFFIAASTRAEYCPIVYVEPAEKQESLLGFDIESTPECRAAIQRAKSTKQPAAGLCMSLNGDVSRGIMLFVVAPVANDPSVPAKSSGNRANAAGFVLGLFQIDAVARSALDPIAASGIAVSVTAPSGDPADDVVIYPNPYPAEERAAAESPENLRYETQIHVADCRWDFDCVALKAFWKRRSTWEPTTVLLAGLLVTGFLVGYLRLLTERTARVEHLVAEKTRELLEGEQRFRRLVDNAGDSFFLHDVPGKLLDVNRRACESLGYTREELLSMMVSDVDTQYIPGDFERHSLLPLEEYPVSFEGVHRRKDGTTFPVEIRLTSLVSGGQRLLLGLARDISDRLQMQKTVREGQLKLSAILDQTYQFIGLMTPEGVLLEANKSALVFSGVSTSEVLDRPFWETAWWSHSAALQEELREAVHRAAGGDFVRLEATHLAANGELHWIDFSLKPVKDETGKVVFLIPEGRDITSRKRIEEALHKEQQLLRNLLDLQEQDRKLVAYDIHDGLAQTLAGALYKFQSIEHQPDDAAAHEMFEGSIALLRDAMAETRRLISGLRPPILDESGVIDAVSYMIAQQQQQPGDPKIEFVHPNEFPRLAQPLESATFRIVQESLTNACRHSGSDKVRVELRLVEKRVYIEVRDWGIGFDPTHVEQGHYGLQGIRERARLLEGSASIESVVGAGTCIAVFLPLLLPMESDATRKELEPKMDVD
jgi:PAS domain S-box-containing protein